MKNKNYYKKHEELNKRWCLRAQKKWPDARFFKRDVGFFRTIRGTPIKIGRKGQSDVYGYIPYGIDRVLWVEVEFKTGKAVQTSEQKAWEVTVNNLRGLYCLIRDENDMEQIEKEINKRMSILV